MSLGINLIPWTEIEIGYSVAAGELFVKSSTYFLRGGPRFILAEMRAALGEQSRSR